MTRPSRSTSVPRARPRYRSFRAVGPGRLSSSISVLLLTAAVGTVVPALAAPAHEATAGPGRPGDSFLIVENAGQWHPAARFQARARGMTLWVTETSLWLTQLGPPPATRAEPDRPGKPGATDRTEPRQGVHLQLTFARHGADVRLVAGDPRPTRMHYFLGSDPSRWRWGVRTYGAVTWRGLDPGISATLAEARGEPALVVEAARGADLRALRLRVAGAEAYGWGRTADSWRTPPSAR